MSEKNRTLPLDEVAELASQAYFLGGRDPTPGESEATIHLVDAGTSGSSLDAAQEYVASQGWPKPTEVGARIAWTAGRTLMVEPSFMTKLGRDAVDNAKRLFHQYGDRIVYTPQFGWMVFDGRRWFRDTDLTQMLELAERTITAEYIKAAKIGGDDGEALAKWIIQTRKANYGFELMVKRCRPFARSNWEKFDQHRLLLNVENGTLNLETGELQEPKPSDYITKLAPVVWDEEAECPEFRQTLEYAFPQKELIPYFLAICFHTLIGGAKQKMVINYGESGDNAKTTVMDAILRTLGSDYARTAGVEILTGKGTDNANYSALAALRGVRFAPMDELPKKMRLNLRLMKRLTGGGEVDAKFMRQDIFTYKPEFVVWVQTNFKPKIRDTEDRVWKRILLMPWDGQVPKEVRVDRADIDARLDKERAGILRWIVEEGGAYYQEKGLEEMPISVREANEDYRTESDTWADFRKAVLVEGGNTPKARMSEALNAWAEHEFGWKSKISAREAGGLLESWGYEVKQVRITEKNRKCWAGVRLEEDFEAALTEYRGTQEWNYEGPKQEDTDDEIPGFEPVQDEPLF